MCEVKRLDLPQNSMLRMMLFRKFGFDIAIAIYQPHYELAVEIIDPYDGWIKEIICADDDPEVVTTVVKELPICSQCGVIHMGAAIVFVPSGKEFKKTGIITNEKEAFEEIKKAIEEVMY